MARPGAGPRPAGMASARPYGHAPVGRARGGVQHRFLMLGIPFLVLNGLGLLAATLIILVLFVFIGAVATDARGSGGGGGGMLAGLAGLIMVVLLLFLGFVIAAGVLCIKGRTAGWWMAMIYTGIGALFQIIGLALSASSPEGENLISTLVGLLFSGGLITLGIFDMKAYKAKQAAAPQGGQPMPVQPRMGPPGAPRPRGNTSVRMAPSARMKAPAAAEPVAQAEAAPPMDEPVAEQVAEQVAEAPQPAGPPPNATHPKAAAVQILALAANVEPELAPARLEKARAAATKLLGEGSSADMDAWMTSPLPVTDFAAQMAEVADLVGSNAKLAQGVVKCAQFALKAADGSFTEGAQIVLDTLQQQFPAPQPVQAPPAAIAPAPPPIQAAPPPVYAPAPPPAAPGVALPRQRRRRPM